MYASDFIQIRLETPRSNSIRCAKRPLIDSSHTGSHARFVLCFELRHSEPNLEHHDPIILLNRKKHCESLTRPLQRRRRPQTHHGQHPDTKTNPTMADSGCPECSVPASCDSYAKCAVKCAGDGAVGVITPFCSIFRYKANKETCSVVRSVEQLLTKTAFDFCNLRE